MKFSFSVVCLMAAMFVAGCTTTPSETVPPGPEGNSSYTYHQNNASTTAAKMIAPANY